MKKIISILIIVFLSANTFAQTNMIIRKSDQSTIAVPISEIDSVYYEDNSNVTLTDIDGNTYNTVQIGTQVWMAEDLKVTHYPNGDAIPNVTDNADWGNLEDDNTADAYCFYNNDNTTDYGALYTYAAAIGDNWVRDNVENQGVCPDGWHLPTDAEWTTLTDYLGGQIVAGGKMKEIGTTHWGSPNTGADNSSGFSALPTGYRRYFGIFDHLGGLGYWWSATENFSNSSYHRSMSSNNAEASRYSNDKSSGCSVRCVKD